MLIECERLESVPYLKMAAIELRANASELICLYSSLSLE